MTRQASKRCLFVQHTAQRSGSPISGLAVVDSLVELGYGVDVILAVRGPLEADYRERGCTLSHIPHGVWLMGGPFGRQLIHLFKELKAGWRIHRAIRKSHARLVYVNTLVSVAAVVAARLSGVQVVWHIREMFVDVGGEMNWPIGGPTLVRWLAQTMPTRVVAVSGSALANVTGKEPGGKFEVIGNPIPDSFFQDGESSSSARDGFDLPGTAFVVALPGTIRPVKGHDWFLDAAAVLLERDPGYMFLISGDHRHEYGEQMRAKCERLGLSSRVRFVGQVDDMRRFYAASDVVCVPSISESFGRTAVEAFAQRRPVIATRTGGMIDTVINGETGLLVECRDVAGLVHAVQKLRTDEPLRSSLVARAWDQANALYRNSVIQLRLRTLLTSLSSSAPPS